MYEQVTAEEIILAIVENMHQCLEPLLYTTWAPSLYHVYLRRADYERLRGLFPAIVGEAKQALDQELESLNAKSKGSGGLLGRFRKEPQPQRRHMKPAEGWNISFNVVEDDLEETERYRVEAWLVPPPQPDFDPSRQTIRVRTTGSSGAGERFKTLRVSGEASPPPASSPPASPTPASPAAPTPDAAPAPAPTPTPPPQAAPAPPPPAPETYLRSGAPSAQTPGSPPPERREPPTPWSAEPARTPDPSEVPTAPPAPPADFFARLSSGAPDSSPLRTGAPPASPAAPSIAPTQRTHERVYATFTFADNDGRRTYRMTKPQVAIGRGRVDYWVDIKLRTKSDVSHEHAVVRYDERERRFLLKDLSTFGTTVNGVRVPSSVERTGPEKRDLEVWVPLPSRALIGLADVIDLDFAAATEDA